MKIHQKENFFFNHAITIISLITYYVCDEKGKTIFDMPLYWILLKILFLSANSDRRKIILYRVCVNVDYARAIHSV